MPRSNGPTPTTSLWTSIPDPDGRFSTGIPDFDRLLGGGVPRGSTTLFRLDETVGLEDLDLILFPTLLNMLYHSRGLIAVLPSRDSPRDFRARLTRFVTRRRFDSRARICDYAGEDEGAPYVVHLAGKQFRSLGARPSPKEREAALAKMIAAERAARGSGGKPFAELTAFEVFETLLGADAALQLFYHGVKRTRTLGNLGIGVLGPGLGVSAGVRRMADHEIELRRDEVGLIVRGVRPEFPRHVATVDPDRGAPHVTFTPRPG